MRNKIIFTVAALGVVAGIVAVFLFSRPKPAEPPVFQPAANPFLKGIYAEGIIESHQSNGENINIYPEVAGTVTRIFAEEGRNINKGQPLLALDDSVQRATVAQLKAQSEAAYSMLQELKAQPRKETLAVVQAQVQAAKATLKNVRDQLRKLRRSYAINPQSVSKNDLDNAVNAVNIAKSNVGVYSRQYDLTKAGAWIYDIRNQEHQYEALTKSYLAAKALLDKYVIKAPVNGVVLAIRAATGSYVSGQGTYGTYTQGFNPVIVMGGSQTQLQVRCYVDEILVHRLPDPTKIDAQMTVRGTEVKIPLSYVRVEPYITPKIELSDQRLERVDVRVLPVIFTFEMPRNVNVFPGQLVDVYIGEKKASQGIRIGRAGK